MTWRARRGCRRSASTAGPDFRGWLFAIGRHRAVDASRARIRSRGRLLTAALVPVTAPSPVEDEVLDRLSARQAVAVVAGLSPDQAEVVALRIIAGLDTAAAARILGKSPGAVRIALHRGLRALSADPRLRALESADQRALTCPAGLTCTTCTTRTTWPSRRIRPWGTCSRLWAPTGPRASWPGGQRR
jgi:DNA-directed RNA polymerase specialized sigma24 family protein